MTCIIRVAFFTATYICCDVNWRSSTSNLMLLFDYFRDTISRGFCRENVRAMVLPTWMCMHLGALKLRSIPSARKKIISSSYSVVKGSSGQRKWCRHPGVFHECGEPWSAPLGVSAVFFTLPARSNVSSFVMNTLWLTESKSLVMFKKQRSTNLPSSSHRDTVWEVVGRLVRHDLPFMKPCWAFEILWIWSGWPVIVA